MRCRLTTSPHPMRSGPGSSGSLIAGEFQPGEEIRQAAGLGALASAGLADLADALTCTGRGRAECPPCPTSPWVVLARVTPASSGDVEIRNDPYRRYVASFGAYSFRCRVAEDRKTIWMPQEPKVSALIDLAQRDEAMPATATVAAHTGTGNWVVVPGNFEVNEGETLGALLAREGNRTLVDPLTGDAIRLAELYAAAGADPKTKVNSVADALAPLEGERLDVPGLRVVRSQLTDLIESRASTSLSPTTAARRLRRASCRPLPCAASATSRSSARRSSASRWPRSPSSSATRSSPPRPRAPAARRGSRPTPMRSRRGRRRRTSRTSLRRGEASTVHSRAADWMPGPVQTIADPWLADKSSSALRESASGARISSPAVSHRPDPPNHKSDGPLNRPGESGGSGLTEAIQFATPAKSWLSHWGWCCWSSELPGY